MLYLIIFDIYQRKKSIWLKKNRIFCINLARKKNDISSHYAYVPSFLGYEELPTLFVELELNSVALSNHFWYISEKKKHFVQKNRIFCINLARKKNDISSRYAFVPSFLGYGELPTFFVELEFNSVALSNRFWYISEKKHVLLKKIGFSVLI